MPTIKSIKLFGNSYQVHPFADVYLLPILEIIRLGSEANFAQMSEAAAVIKEVIVEGLPRAVIRENANGKYIFNLESKELSNLLTSVLEIYYLYRAEFLRENGAPQQEIVVADERLIEMQTAFFPEYFGQEVALPTEAELGKAQYFADVTPKRSTPETLQSETPLGESSGGLINLVNDNIPTNVMSLGIAQPSQAQNTQTAKSIDELRQEIEKLEQQQGS